MKKQKQTARSYHQTLNIDELINDLPEEILRTLHDRIVSQLNKLQRQRTMQSMADFRSGDVVRFLADGSEITGVLVRLNKKSVTIHTENGNRWNVAPQLLSLVKRPLGPDIPGNILGQSVSKELH
jgi:predicted extracellular nuclease